MSKYTGKSTRVEASPEVIAARFSDLSVLKDSLDKIPESERKRIGNVDFEPDAIVIENPQVGKVRMEVKECSTERVIFGAGGMLPMTIEVGLKGVDENTATEVTPEIDINIPMMLRPLVSPHLQKAADQFGDLIAKIASVDAK